jgi:hypothetical protein
MSPEKYLTSYKKCHFENDMERTISEVIQTRLRLRLLFRLSLICCGCVENSLAKTWFWHTISCGHEELLKKKLHQGVTPISSSLHLVHVSTVAKVIVGVPELPALTHLASLFTFTSLQPIYLPSFSLIICQNKLQKSIPRPKMQKPRNPFDLKRSRSFFERIP